MSAIGGTGGFGAAPPERGGRRRPPTPLATALVLVHALCVITVVGGAGAVLTAASYGSLDGGLLALVAYGAAPGVLGHLLARRTGRGGRGTWLGLVVVQLWLLVGAVGNLAAGSPRGAVQLLVPAVVLALLLRPQSRDWYGLPDADRAGHRPFSVARMIRWRSDGGQTSVEYAGLVALVAAVVIALLVTGLGAQIYGELRATVCEVTGTACPASPTRTATDASGQPGKAPADTPQGSADDDAKDQGGGDGGGDDDDGCFSGVGAFFGCAGDQVKQVGQGLVVDGVWGDLTGVYDLVRHPADSFSGLADYGSHLGDEWLDNSRDAARKWSGGDYLGALLDWGGASLKTGGTVLWDMFVGDDVADRWNDGEQTRAVTTVLWNVGSLFIPGYDGAKLVEKAGVLGRLGKLGKLAEKAAEAAEDARKAARAGDLEGAEKAAKEADDAAAEAERKARETGCVIAAPPRRAPYAGDPGAGVPVPPRGAGGTGTTVLAAGPAAPVRWTATPRPSSFLLAQDGCDEEAERAAREAREQADAADRAVDEAEGKNGGDRPAGSWQAKDDIAGPARGKLLKFPNKRHTASGWASGQVKERNTVILRGNEDLVRADIEGIAEGRAELLPDGNTYRIDGRTYEVEGNGTVFPKSGPGLVELDRIEYAALKEIARNKGDLDASQQLRRDPKFVDNPAKVQKAKEIYDGTYQ
ncbi:MULTISPECIES: hypothetical protein [Streptomyces]|uniref:Uncharacterized protein n=1 Tax=Streptomyces doudnae TaxID=3075536 RepID=A0ABD5EIJ3_9ACTN|nr:MULTISPECIES: hypothetical protein [unclassified Streptomyces]MDT0434425.1 hypothetical protein [Streptomyces sp. DSM 41981]MYQ64056.1 hypothetical protein [Streptomyces sp. SID4950]SCD70784.1 hypothetical protein GA0115242_112475 [Streptomyces sp. SolWspMP-5a-2]